jgi:hypothetical protein
MTLAARFSLLHSDLNEFLFASVGDEQNGMPLNVMSALTRLGIDPWEEASRLAALPKAAAAESLAPVIARMPVGRPRLSDNLALSQGLVALLPLHLKAVSSSREQTADKDKRYFHAVLLLAVLALGAEVLTAIL